MKAAGDVALNETNFPDEAFRKYVREQLDLNKDGKRSAYEVGSAQDLNCAGTADKKGEIKFLKGIAKRSECAAMVTHFMENFEE